MQRARSPRRYACQCQLSKPQDVEPLCCLSVRVVVVVQKAVNDDALPKEINPTYSSWWSQKYGKTSQGSKCKAADADPGSMANSDHDQDDAGDQPASSHDQAMATSKNKDKSDKKKSKDGKDKKDKKDKNKAKDKQKKSKSGQDEEPADGDGDDKKETKRRKKADD